MSESHEARQLEIFGSKLFFETNAVAADGPGKVAYIMSAQTQDHVKYNQSLHEGSGDARIYAEKRLQIESGVKSETNNQAFNVRIKNGHGNITTENGNFTISGDKIVLEAASELVLHAPKIKIGYDSPGKTDQVTINAQNIKLNAGGKCTLRNKIMYKNGLTSPFSKAYNKWYNSLLPDGGGGGGFGGGLGGLAGQAAGAYVSSQTGGLL